MPSEYPIAANINSVVGPGLIEPRHYQRLQPATAPASTIVEVNGDGAAAGTLLVSIPIAPQFSLHIWQLLLAARIAAKRFLVVQSSTPAVGGAEVPRLDLDLPGAGQMALNGGLAPLTIIRNANAIGGATIYCNIYIPQARGGVATNNAVGQFCSASAMVTLDPN